MPPPPSPSPPAPAESTVTFDLTFQGTVSDFGPLVILTLKVNLAEKMSGISPLDISISVEAASVIVSVAITTTDATDAQNAADYISNSDTATLTEDLQVGTVEAKTKPTVEGAAAESRRPCFPSTATIAKADGMTVTIDTLKEGDEIVAATADGSLTTDTVSIFSLAHNEVEATFIKLNTDGGRTLTLTPTHHLPVGAFCCSNLKMAKEVTVGEVVWAIGAAGAIVAQTVASTGLAIEKGLHNPLLTNGNFPLVDGIVTSFNTMSVVTFDSYAVPYLTALCKATGTCATLRKAIAAAECAYNTFLKDGMCKTFNYIDGVVAHGTTTIKTAAIPSSKLDGACLK